MCHQLSKLILNIQVDLFIPLMNCKFGKKTNGLQVFQSICLLSMEDFRSQLLTQG